MQDALIILNPYSGRRSHRERERRLREAFADRGLRCSICCTEAEGHAVGLVRAGELEASRCVIAAGGDGTVSEVMNGLMLEQRQGRAVPPLGILALGSGNDFAANMGVPETLDALLQVLGRDSLPTRRADVGHLCWGGREHFFVNNLGLGFEARVNRRSREIRWLRGLPLYLYATLRTLFERVVARAVVEVEGPAGSERRELQLMQLSLANGARTGGGFRLLPGAEPDDGLMDLMLVPPLGRPAMLWLLQQILRQKHTTRGDLHFLRCTRLQFSAAPALPLYADGEFLCEAADELEVVLLPGALRLLAD